jgi:thymidylate synthase (FAD)
VAIEVLRQLQGVAPNVFADFTISILDDGTEVATSPYTPQG